MTFRTCLLACTLLLGAASARADELFGGVYAHAVATPLSLETGDNDDVPRARGLPFHESYTKSARIDLTPAASSARPRTSPAAPAASAISGMAWSKRPSAPSATVSGAR